MGLDENVSGTGRHAIALRANEFMAIPPPASGTAARLPIGTELRHWLRGTLGLRRAPKPAPPLPAASREAKPRKDWAGTWDVRELDREVLRRAERSALDLRRLSASSVGKTRLWRRLGTVKG